MPAVFTDVGENLATDYFDGTANAPANWFVHWGTGTTAPVVTNTVLETPASEARVTATEAQPASNQNRLTATLTANGAKTISEVGVFDAASAGNMPVRGTFTGIVLATNDKIDFTITITWTGS